MQRLRSSLTAELCSCIFVFFLEFLGFSGFHLPNNHLLDWVKERMTPSLTLILCNRSFFLYPVISNLENGVIITPLLVTERKLLLFRCFAFITYITINQSINPLIHQSIDRRINRSNFTIPANISKDSDERP